MPVSFPESLTVPPDPPEVVPPFPPPMFILSLLFIADTLKKQSPASLPLVLLLDWLPPPGLREIVIDPPYSVHTSRFKAPTQKAPPPPPPFGFLLLFNIAQSPPPPPPPAA